jgi:hypothetical protein
MNRRIDKLESGRSEILAALIDGGIGPERARYLASYEDVDAMLDEMTEAEIDGFVGDGVTVNGTLHRWENMSDAEVDALAEGVDPATVLG